MPEDNSNNVVVFGGVVARWQAVLLYTAYVMICLCVFVCIGHINCAHIHKFANIILIDTLTHLYALIMIQYEREREREREREQKKWKKTFLFILFVCIFVIISVWVDHLKSSYIGSFLIS